MNDRVRRATLLMEQNLATPLSIEEIAKRINISRRQLDRVFSQELNHPPRCFTETCGLNLPDTCLHIPDDP